MSCVCCSDQPMDGSGILGTGGGGLFGDLGGQPSAAKANTNVFGAVSFAGGQQSSGGQLPCLSYLTYLNGVVVLSTQVQFWSTNTWIHNQCTCRAELYRVTR